MTKADLIEEVSQAGKLTRRDAEVVVETVFESMSQALARGEKIELRGFGSFRVQERSARRARNPKTGEEVDVPARKVPRFRPGREMRELLNRSA
jgi:integration host factor subunit beta